MFSGEWNMAAGLPLAAVKNGKTSHWPSSPFTETLPKHVEYDRAVLGTSSRSKFLRPGWLGVRNKV
jgi:hypothetical protein